jgi:formyl-CoA transferase
VAGQDAGPLLGALAAADVPASLVNSVADLAVDPHVQSQDAVVAVTNSRGQQMLVPAVTPRLVEGPGGIRWTGEPLGGSNDAVYRGLLGLGPDRLDDLRTRGVI